MKIGPKGCVILNDGLSLTVPGEDVQARDTTGAGDAFAAGFLYGLLTERDLEVCGRIANRVASRVVQVEGCRVDLLSREELLKGF
jgi:sugar/nucleoside kinase (ribokinase family)